VAAGRGCPAALLRALPASAVSACRTPGSLRLPAGLSFSLSCTWSCARVPWARREQYALPCYRARLSRERARRLVHCNELCIGQASVLVFQICMGEATYKRVKKIVVEHGPADSTATPTGPISTPLARIALTSSEPQNTQNRHLPPTPPPTMLFQLANARHHKDVATVELILSNRGRLLMSAASAAHFSLFSMTA
jgi:hypothetical protein